MDDGNRQHEEEVLRRHAGLCGTCGHVRILVSDKGSAFAQCGKGLEDIAYAKYPQLPVLRCGAWVAAHAGR